MKNIVGIILLLGLTLCACEDIIEVEDISDNPPVIIAPDNNAVLSQNTITFSWYEVYEAETYRLQIATPNFDSTQQLLVDEIIDTVNYNTSLSSGSYQWRVKSINSAYESPYTIHNLTIE